MLLCEDNNVTGNRRESDQSWGGVSVETMPQVHLGGFAYCDPLNDHASFHVKDKGQILVCRCAVRQRHLLYPIRGAVEIRQRGYVGGI